MEVKPNGDRYNCFKKWESRKHMPYDYANEGLVNKIMSNKIYNTENPILRGLISVFEQAIVCCLKYADVLANYKDFRNRNR